jgi:hypothetical protein
MLAIPLILTLSILVGLPPQSALPSPQSIDAMTGTWVLNRTRSEGLTGGLKGAEVELVVERKEKEWTVSQVVRIRGRQVPSEPLRYQLDGRETYVDVVRPLAGTMELVARLLEDGDILSLKSTISGEDQGKPVTLLTRETWQMIDQGKRLQIVRVREWGTQSQESTLIFERR